MNFRRASTKNRKEVGSSWRRPRGTHNKQTRERNKGPMPTAGYGSPKDQRHKIQGKEVVLVHNIQELHDKKACIIAKVGAKKRKEILEEAKKRNILIINHDIEKALKAISERFEAQKKAKEKKIVMSSVIELPKRRDNVNVSA